MKRQFRRRSNMARVTIGALYNVRCSYSGNSQSVKQERENRCVLSMFLNVDNVGAERPVVVCCHCSSSRRPDQPHKMPGCRVVALFWERPNHHEQRNGGEKGWEQWKQELCIEYCCHISSTFCNRSWWIMAVTTQLFSSQIVY